MSRILGTLSRGSVLSISRQRGAYQYDRLAKGSLSWPASAKESESVSESGMTTTWSYLRGR